MHNLFTGDAVIIGMAIIATLAIAALFVCLFALLFMILSLLLQSDEKATTEADANIGTSDVGKQDIKLKPGSYKVTAYSSSAAFHEATLHVSHSGGIGLEVDGRYMPAYAWCRIGPNALLGNVGRK